MATEHMECPECGEDAVHTPPTDLVPWAAHGMQQPQWSHTDGSSLCPVLGDSGGYVPVQPRPRATERQPGPDVSRLDPPERLRPEGWARAHEEPSGPFAVEQEILDRWGGWPPKTTEPGVSADPWAEAKTGPEHVETGETGDGRDARVVTTGGRLTSLSEPKTGKAAAEATQAVLDAINNGQLTAEQPDGCDFWAAKAAQAEPGPTERQLEDWNIHNDHADGLAADYDLDREA